MSERPHPQMTWPERLVRDRALLVLVAATALGAALRFATLGLQSLDEDETVSVWLMHHSLWGLLADIPRTESTPPLFYVLEWLWTRVFGTGAVGMRSFSAALGVLTIPLSWLVARELAGRRAGAITAVLVALSPALVWYSQEARAYALLVLSSAATLLFFVRAVRGSSTAGRHPLVWWAASACLALTTHYYAFFLVAAEAVWLLLARGSVRRAHALVAIGVVGAAALALSPLALQQASNGGSDWIGEIPLWGRLSDVPPQVMLGEGRPLTSWPFALVVAVPLIVPALLALLRGGRAGRRAIALPVTIGLAGIALPVLVDIAGKHILLDRNTLGAGVLLLFACGVGMASMRARTLGLVALVSVAGLFVWNVEMVMTNPLMQREPWRDASRSLGEASVPRAIVFGPNVSNPAPAPELVTFQAVYLKSMLTMPDRGWNVREIDELDVRDDLSDASPRPDPVSPGRDWRLVGRSCNRTYTLYRFSSGRPRHVTPDQLFGENLLANRDEGDTLIGLQVPARRSTRS